MSTMSAAPGCDQSTGIEVMPNVTQSRICGVRSSDTTLPMSECCGSAQVHMSTCSQFCASTTTIGDWASCLKIGNSTTASGFSDVFCQSGIVANDTTSLAKTSSALQRSSAPRYSQLFLLALGICLCTRMTAATVVPSLAQTLQRRSDSDTNTCMVEIAHNYTQPSSSSITVSPELDCTTGPCPTSILLDTPITSNNRTVNGSSAAEPMYDTFFDLLQNKTRRAFPAMSNIQLQYDFFLKSGLNHVSFTPLQWCMKGTITGCHAVIGNSNATTPIEACGPVFVQTDMMTQDSLRNATMQGVISVLAS